MQLLLVEDDQSLALGLRTALNREGFTINAVENGGMALSVVSSETPDIVILDLGLPDMDGIDVLKQIRKTHVDLPVLILTARSSLDDKVQGLGLGADDYLAKPFEVPELVARLRVIERRLSSTRTSVIEVGDVSLDTQAQRVSKSGQPLELPRREYMLLKYLMENLGKVLTRESLENKMYQWGEEVSSNAIEVHIHHLRKKLGSQLIKTVRGVGYTIKKQ